MSDIIDMDAATLQRALKLVYDCTGITMTEGKKTMLQSRMRQRMRLLRVTSYSHYLDQLVKDATEWQPFIDVVTTHQTTFFRTPKVWQYFQDEFLPALLNTTPQKNKPLRVWSAAASTGEEACSVAICCEEFRRQNTGFDYEILGTDISTEVLAQARKGEYDGTSVAHFRKHHPGLFERYNDTKADDRFALSAPVRKRMRFETCNLMTPQPSWREHFDLIFLRNVLIYFQAEDARRLVHQIAPTLRGHGQLIIGESESLTGQNVPFKFLQPQVYQRSLA